MEATLAEFVLATALGVGEKVMILAPTPSVSIARGQHARPRQTSAASWKPRASWKPAVGLKVSCRGVAHSVTMCSSFMLPARCSPSFTGRGRIAGGSPLKMHTRRACDYDVTPQQAPLVVHLLEGRKRDRNGAASEAESGRARK